LNLNKKITYKELIPAPLDQAFFVELLQKEALEQTLAFMKESGSTVAFSFSEKILARSKSTGLGFSLTESSEAISERPAGYVRAQGHIIMNYAVMNRDDWLFLFIHEFSHLIDPNLETAVEEAIADYQTNPNFAAQMISSVQTIHSLSELSLEKQMQIDRFLSLSLQRGWIAEVSAWANTLTVYSDLRVTGKMNAVPWADEMINQKLKQQDWIQFFATYLRSRFNYPDNVIYRNPLLRARSDQIEREILEKLR